jgi:hypothetical protein
MACGNYYFKSPLALEADNFQPNLDTWILHELETFICKALMGEAIVVHENFFMSDSGDNRISELNDAKRQSKRDAN